MLVNAFEFEPLRRHARGRRANLVLGLEIDALRLKAAMIDACIDIEFGKPWFACSAQRSRHFSSRSVRFQSRFFFPKPFSSTSRVVIPAFRIQPAPAGLRQSIATRRAETPKSDSAPRFRGVERGHAKRETP